MLSLNVGGAGDCFSDALQRGLVEGVIIEFSAELVVTFLMQVITILLLTSLNRIRPFLKCYL